MMIKWAFNFRAWQPTRSEWMFCGQCIQNEEKDRIQRFVFKKDAKAAMVGQIIIEIHCLLKLFFYYEKFFFHLSGWKTVDS